MNGEYKAQRHKVEGKKNLITPTIENWNTGNDCAVYRLCYKCTVKSRLVTGSIKAFPLTASSLGKLAVDVFLDDFITGDPVKFGYEYGLRLVVKSFGFLKTDLFIDFMFNTRQLKKEKKRQQVL